jgi:hypothetical protein
MPEHLELLSLLNTPFPAELGPGPRPDVASESALDARLQGMAGWRRLPAEKQELTRGLLLLWHDHLDAAHTIAQSIDSADGAYVHGIMHRREPDYGNAAYWFRRVGRHRAFADLAERASNLLKSPADQTLKQRLVRGDQWDPCAFIDACERAAAGEASEAEKQRLIGLQRLEFQTLLETIVGA